MPHWLPFQRPAKTILQPMVTDDYILNESFIELLDATSRHTTTHLLFPAVFGDEELRQIEAPTRLVLGEKEIIYDPGAAAERAQRLIPELEIALIPNASHLLTMQHPKIVNRRILIFLQNGGPALLPEVDRELCALPPE